MFHITGNMKYFIVSLFFVAATAHHGVEHDHLVSVSTLNEIADYVNNKADSTWQANKFHTTTNDETFNSQYRVGVFDSPPVGYVSDADERATQCENNGLPKQFDSRKRWPECASVIGHIYDQGNCGSCWAVSAASVFSDRVCIASKGKIRALFSGQQILSCCHRCAGRDGCQGGWPETAFSYIRRNGLTTGGDYESKQGCQPYLLRHCDHHVNGTYDRCSKDKYEKAPKCKLHCYNNRYRKSFREDKIKAKKHYSVAPCAMMNEIYTSGPILSIFSVFEDFLTYKSGVYQYTTGKRVGKHAVRVIGWGEENGVPYWLVANSWNNNWGNNGFFKIKRESNECWIEDDTMSITPELNK